MNTTNFINNLILDNIEEEIKKKIQKFQKSYLNHLEIHVTPLEYKECEIKLSNVSLSIILSFKSRKQKEKKQKEEIVQVKQQNLIKQVSKINDFNKYFQMKVVKISSQLYYLDKHYFLYEPKEIQIVAKIKDDKIYWI